MREEQAVGEVVRPPSFFNRGVIQGAAIGGIIAGTLTLGIGAMLGAAIGGVIGGLKIRNDMSQEYRQAMQIERRNEMQANACRFWVKLSIRQGILNSAWNGKTSNRIRSAHKNMHCCRNACSKEGRERKAVSRKAW
jgi:uncharacterized protein YcfJ